MCDFKPGDEVVAVDGKEAESEWRGPLFDFSAVYVVEDVIVWRGRIGLVIAGMHSTHPTKAYGAEFFRKVQRRDLTAWLSTSVPNTDALDKPIRAPKRERVS